jgi:hypothetical protein
MKNREITHQFKMPVPALADVSVSIEGKDKNGTEFVYNKDGKIRTPIP